MVLLSSVGSSSWWCTGNRCSTSSARLACCRPTTPNHTPPGVVKLGLMAAAASASLLLSASNPSAWALDSGDTLSNIPPSLSAQVCSPDSDPTCKKPIRIQRPKSRKAETCTVKCLNTCIRGGDGSPGLGPFTIRRPIVVFKKGFRTRQYCLSECSDICNLLGDRDDGP